MATVNCGVSQVTVLRSGSILCNCYVLCFVNYYDIWGMVAVVCRGLGTNGGLNRILGAVEN